MSTVVATRIIYVLGAINVVTGILIFFSCRCLPGSRWGRGLTKFKWYQRFFKLHCLIWWIFWCSVIIHAIFVMVYLGFPF
jgi:hypothetical protein